MQEVEVVPEGGIPDGCAIAGQMVQAYPGWKCPNCPKRFRSKFLGLLVTAIAAHRLTHRK